MKNFKDKVADLLYIHGVQMNELVSEERYKELYLRIYLKCLQPAETYYSSNYESVCAHCSTKWKLPPRNIKYLTSIRPAQST